MPSCVKPGEVIAQQTFERMDSQNKEGLDLVSQVYPDFSESGSFKQVTRLHS